MGRRGSGAEQRKVDWRENEEGERKGRVGNRQVREWKVKDEKKER